MCGVKLCTGAGVTTQITVRKNDQRQQGCNIHWGYPKSLSLVQYELYLVTTVSLKSVLLLSICQIRMRAARS